MTVQAARLSALLAASNVEPSSAVGADPLIRGASVDSRCMQPGYLFFAIPGSRVNGEAFVSDAIRGGACAVVAESPRPAQLDSSIGWVQVAEPRRVAGLLSRECFGRPDEKLALVGVTGTNGKTTVTHLVESIGKAAGRRCGRIGTVGYSFDDLQRPLSRTTPEAPDFYQLLAEMYASSVDLVAVEVSSHALALSRVEGARFSVAALLNISPDHLDFHGNLERYFAAKAKLFDSLGDDQWAVLPADSRHGRQLAERITGPVLTFGRSAGAQVQLLDERCGLDGSAAILKTPSGTLPIRTFQPGPKNLENIAAAAACALALKLPPESIPAGVLALLGVPGRMERIDRGQGFTVLVDYAHSVDALDNLLQWARDVARARVIVVFGCGGDRDTGKRAAMGRVAARSADRILLTSDNPRGEDPQRILEQVAEGLRTVEGAARRSRMIADREQAIREAISDARQDDIVLIAGKGSETIQIVGDEERPFDDREVARRTLHDLGWTEERRAGA